MLGKKEILGWSKVCLTWLVVILMAFDACSAGGVLRRFIRCRFTPVVNYCSVSPAPPCPVVETCAPVSYVSYAAPIVYESVSSEAPTCHDCTVTACDGMCGDYSDACGGGGVIVDECAGVVDYGYSDCCGRGVIVDGNRYGGHVVSEGTVVDHTEDVRENTNQNDVVQPDPSSADATSPGGFVEEDSTPMPNSDDSTADDDWFHDNNGPADPVPNEPAPTTGLDNPLPTDADDLDDLFGNDAPTTPVPTEPVVPATDLGDPMPTDSGGLDDLFGDDARTIPAEPATVPSTDFDDPMPTDDTGLDDLFGDDAPKTRIPTEPAAEIDDPMPTDDGGLDDLFGDDTTTTAPVPTEPDADFDDPMPTDDGDLDDLFGDSPAETTPGISDDGLGDDLFGDPSVDEDAPLDPSDNEGLDDLFKDSSAAKEPNSFDVRLEDLFGNRSRSRNGSRPVETEATRTISFVSKRMPFRAWWDNTGNYRTIGSLLVVGEDHVRLIKANGRTCTVPFHRLSDADLEYVQTQVEQHTEGLKVAAK